MVDEFVHGHGLLRKLDKIFRLQKHQIKSCFTKAQKITKSFVFRAVKKNETIPIEVTNIC
jgi:hypothetical protein